LPVRPGAGYALDASSDVLDTRSARAKHEHRVSIGYLVQQAGNGAFSGGSSLHGCWGERKITVPQTKSKSSTRRSGSSKPRSSSSKSNGSSRSSTKASKAKASAAKARGKSAQSPKSAQSSNGSNGVANGVADSVKRGAKGIPPLASKAKVPLLASGAALAGVAGAVAAARSGKRQKVMGVPMPKTNGMKPDAKKIGDAVVDAAKRADRFGQGVSRVANTVRDVGETANKAAKKI